MINEMLKVESDLHEKQTKEVMLTKPGVVKKSEEKKLTEILIDKQ
jgi:hypothetical protein